MVGLLALLFLLVPIAELAVIVQVSGALGLGNTIVILIVVSVVGAWLVRREGLGVLRRVQDQVGRGVVPGRELMDGFMIMLAGAFMLTPGFLTDALGIALLLPPVRALVRATAARRLRARTTTTVYEVRGRETDQW